MAYSDTVVFLLKNIFWTFHIAMCTRRLTIIDMAEKGIVNQSLQLKWTQYVFYYM